MFNIFHKKVEWNNSIEQLLSKMQDVDWGANVGEISSEDLQIGYAWKSINRKEAETIGKKRSLGMFTNSYDLINEATARLNVFIYKHHPKEHQKTWSEVVSKVRKEFKSRNLFLNPIQIGNLDFPSLNLVLFFELAILELYFVYLNEIPVFSSDVISVFIAGKLIMGWEGRLEYNKFLSTPINKKEGTLLVF